MMTRRLLASTTASITAVAAALSLAPPAAHAAPMTYIVDTTSDDPLDGVTLREAIDEANGNLGHDTIVFADGVTGTITLTSGELTIDDHLTISGPGSDSLRIDGDASSRVFNVLGSGYDIELSGLTVANGSDPGSGGGAQISQPGEVTIDDVRFVDNLAGTDGGGLSIGNPTGPITMTNSFFGTNGVVGGGDGGGLHLTDIAANVHPIVIENTSFVENTSDGTSAGALISASDRPLTIDGSLFDRNIAALAGGGVLAVTAGARIEKSVFTANEAGNTGGGLFVFAGGGGDIFVADTEIVDNVGTQGGGAFLATPDRAMMTRSLVADNTGTDAGGVMMTGDRASISLSTFRDNNGTNAGGALLNASTAATVSRSTFARNVGGTTGGVQSVSATTNVTASTFESNDAPGGTGGAIGVGGAAADIETSTITGNSAAEGAGVYASGPALTLTDVTMVENAATVTGGGVSVDGGSELTLLRTILDGNTAPAGAQTDDLMVDADFSLIGDTTGLTITGSDNVLDQDPQLGPLQDNGGPTLTHLPAAASPVIDAGGPPPVSDTDDQRGAFVGDQPFDIGSVERAGATSLWTPVVPTRVVDTRAIGETIDGMDEGEGRLTADSEVRYEIAGRAGVPADAVAVVANITAVRPGDTGFLTAHPCVNPRPVTASLNYTADVSLGNEIIIGLDAGDLCVYTFADADLTIDVVGFVSAQSTYTPNEPRRLLDTRANGITFDGLQQGGGAPGAGGDVTVDVGRGLTDGKSNTAVLYVTAVKPEAVGFVTVWDCTSDRPLASALNHVGGVNRGNEIVATLSETDEVCIYTSQDVELTVDLVGEFRADDGSSNYASFDAPSRALDTRAVGVTVDGLFQGDGKLVAGETFVLDVAGRIGVAPTATTVTMNLTAVAPEVVGYLTAYPCGTQPLAASVNYVPGVNSGNEIVAPLSDTGQVCIFSSGPIHLTADITGWTSV